MKTKSLILVALFVALSCIGARLQIPMLLVPITLQLLFCLLSGMLLGPRLGALSQALYIALGLIGIPVFAGAPGGGISYLLKPSFGYLIGFIVCALVSGLLIIREKKLTFVKALGASLAGTISVYLIGVPYLYFILMNTAKAIPVATAFTSYFLVFIPGDILKCIVASVLTVKLRPVIIDKKLA